MVILITGGSRSGKSTFALSLAARAEPPRLFVATAQAFDDEMRRRIDNHKAARPAGWGLIEEPVALAAALRAAAQDARTIVVDCVTVWMSNLLLADEAFGEKEAAAAAQDLLEAARPAGQTAGPAAGPAVRPEAGLAPTVIIVTNEVGSGIVPDNALARRFRDCAGRANQVLAAGADEVYLVVSGVPVRVKSSEGASA